MTWGLFKPTQRNYRRIARMASASWAFFCSDAHAHTHTQADRTGHVRIWTPETTPRGTTRQDELWSGLRERGEVEGSHRNAALVGPQPLLAEPLGALLLAELQHLHRAPLVRREAHHLADNVTGELHALRDRVLRQQQRQVSRAAGQWAAADQARRGQPRGSRAPSRFLSCWCRLNSPPCGASASSSSYSSHPRP